MSNVRKAIWILALFFTLIAGTVDGWGFAKTSGHFSSRFSDARWTYTFDNLDRLKTMLESSPKPGETALKIEFTYDAFGRRTKKKISQGTTVKKIVSFLYEGNLLVKEVEVRPGLGKEYLRREYSWGTDVSGTYAGAAGIGGLVEVSETIKGVRKNYLALNDGIGNILGLVDADGGAKVADYDHGPFGEAIEASGAKSASCPLRWQTKYYDEETGLYYWGKRYYDPKTRTWLSRDPLREGGGANHYAYCNNRPFEYCDPVGGSPFLLTGNARFGVVEFIQGWFAERKKIDSDRKKLAGLEGQLPELAQYSRDGRAGMARALLNAKRLQEESAILENDGLIPAGSTDAIYRESMQGVRGIHQLVEAGIDINRRDAANLQAPLSIALMVAPVPFKGGFGRGILGGANRVGTSELGNALSGLGRNPLGRNLNTLNEFGPGAGFSGVYDVASGKFLAYPSGATRLANGEIPLNVVDQLGGHADVNRVLSQLLGNSSTNRLGFSMTLDNFGNFRMGWNSTQVNVPNPSFPGRTVPETLRQQIIDAIVGQTGRSAQ